MTTLRASRMLADHGRLLTSPSMLEETISQSAPGSSAYWSMFRLYSSNAIVPNGPIWTLPLMFTPAPGKIRIVGTASSSLCQDAFGSKQAAGKQDPRGSGWPDERTATPLLSDNLNLDFDANPHDYLRQKVVMLDHR